MINGFFPICVGFGMAGAAAVHLLFGPSVVMQALLVLSAILFACLSLAEDDLD